MTDLADLRQGRFGGADLHALAARWGTPLHVLDFDAVAARVGAFRDAFQGLDARLCYAVKANPAMGLLRRLGALGLGADIVSGGELERCLRAGIPGERIVFSGVGKSADEIRAALAARVWTFNAESAEELDLLDREARAAGVVARVALRINPDVDPRTHAKIATGRAENKFGIDPDTARALFAGAARWPGLRLEGLHAHIGSQLLDVAPIREAVRRLAAFADDLRAAGHPLGSIDVGGGLGVRYRAEQPAPPSIAAYAAIVRENLAGSAATLVLEPGRCLVAEAGVLLTRVLRVKRGRHREFLVLDAGMNDLVRPAMYDAWHDLVPLVGPEVEAAVYDVVGPVCESGDTFAVARRMPRCAEGDLVVIRATGAYGAAMASTYNSRPLAAEVILERGVAAPLRERQTFDALVAGEVW